MALARECAAREKAAEALTRALQAVEVMGAALHQLAAFDDQRASAHLAETGSCAWFDSSDSVKVAREALAKVKELTP